MNFFEKIVHELNEDTPSSRLKALQPEQQKEVKKLKQDLENIFDEMDIKIGYSRNSGSGVEDYRIQVHNSPVDALWIDTALKAKGWYDIAITEIGPGNSESYSGKFPTLKLLTSLGGVVYIVLAGIGKKTLSKQFTPNKFGIENKNISYKELYEIITDKINNSNFEKNIKQYLLYLLDIAVYKPIIKIANIITIEKDEFDESLIDISDKRNIENDFGEILGAIIVARSKKKNNIIYFPKSSNEPLIDYKVGETRYSAKSLSGAAPTLTSMTSYKDFVKNELDAPKEEKNIILKMFSALDKDIGVEQKFLEITKLVDKNAWFATLNLLEVEDLKIDESKQALQLIKDRLDSYYEDGTLEEKLTQYYKKIGTTPKTSIDQYNPKNSWRHGFIIGALSYQIPKILNANKFHILDHMKEIINQTNGIEQIHFNNLPNELKFKIVKLNKNVRIKFVGGGSVTRPYDQNLRFKILN